MPRHEKPPFPLEFGQSAPPEGTVYFVPGTVIYPDRVHRSGVLLTEHLFALAIASKVNGLKGFMAITSANCRVIYNGHNSTVDAQSQFGAYANKAHEY